MLCNFMLLTKNRLGLLTSLKGQGYRINMIGTVKKESGLIVLIGF